MKDKNRNNEDFEMLYDEALSLLNEEGEITTTLLQRKLCIGYEPARQIFDRMLKYGVITEEADFKGKAVDIGDEKSINIGEKRYDVSGTWAQLFICNNDSTRVERTTSVVEQLKNKRVDVLLMSAEPEAFEKSLDAKPLSAEAVDDLLTEKDRRYELIEASNSRNYKQHNENCKDKHIPLFVLVVDGIDKVAEDSKYNIFFENLECLAMKSRAAGIQVVAFINDLTSENKELYARFSPPIEM